MKCEACIHSGVCKAECQPAPLSDTFTYECECIEKYCGDFKARSRFVELPVGEWIYGEDYFDYPVYRCSNCKEQLDFEEGTPKSNDYRFCPFCGAKMEEAEQALKERGKNG